MAISPQRLLAPCGNNGIIGWLVFWGVCSGDCWLQGKPLDVVFERVSLVILCVAVVRGLTKGWVGWNFCLKSAVRVLSVW